MNHLLNLGEEENIFLIEDSLQDLITIPLTAEVVESDLDADDCIEIQNWGMALHFSQPSEFWLVLTDDYSENKILGGKIADWRLRKCRTVLAERGDFLSALIEYFARSMASELLCENCLVEGKPFYNEERIERLEKFLKPIIPHGRSILEICCGNGMATQALLRLGHSPFSMDLDRCELCQALKNGLMDFNRSFVLDARLLSSFFPPMSFDIVLGFMVGLIDRSNWPLWKEIILKAAILARERILFTVYTQNEAAMIAKALREVGWKGNLIDNRDSNGIYDQWAYMATRDEEQKG